MGLGWRVRIGLLVCVNQPKTVARRAYGPVVGSSLLNVHADRAKMGRTDVLGVAAPELPGLDGRV